MGLYPSYPPNTKAFLYYFIASGKPRIAGELRLRVASSDDSASFESGSDLLLTDGRPWARPLHNISKYHLPLYEKLREDGFISDDLDKALSTLPQTKYKFRRVPIIYTLNDRFIIDFGCSTSVFIVVTEQGVEKLKLQRMFFDYRKKCKSSPYTGCIYKLPYFSVLQHWLFS